MANRLFNINNPIFDTDASAFFTATGLTATEAANYYSAVQKFQGLLNRAILF